MRDFVTQGYKEKLLPLPIISLHSTPFTSDGLSTVFELFINKIDFLLLYACSGSR
jgi:hypothetical protein